MQNVDRQGKYCHNELKVLGKLR